MTQYQVITAGSKDKLEQAVSKALKQGFVPVGGVSEITLKAQTVGLMQAIVR